MTNAQMKAGRYLRWQQSRRKVATIVALLQEGHTVYFCTYLRAIKCTAKHVDLIKATKSGTYIRRGKAWDCVDGCKIEVHRKN